jgi:GNAT superfamily N-acetyltransferase
MVTIQRESLHPFWEDALPLFERHWQEIAHWHDIPLVPDTEAYERAEAAGMLRIYTVRGTDGSLYGYAMFFVRHNVHYATSLQAVQDVVFIAPEFRLGTLGMRLLRFADDQLRADGVQAVHHHQKLAHPALGKVLERQGYEAVETIWVKRLDTKV